MKALTSGFLRRASAGEKMTLDATCPFPKEMDYKKCACEVVKA